VTVILFLRFDLRQSQYHNVFELSLKDQQTEMAVQHSLTESYLIYWWSTSSCQNSVDCV